MKRFKDQAQAKRYFAKHSPHGICGFRIGRERWIYDRQLGAWKSWIGRHSKAVINAMYTERTKDNGIDKSAKKTDQTDG